jgi:hypothetical protein
MRFDKVLLTVNIKLKAKELQSQLPRSADISGQVLAEIADEYARQNNTGYYPAFEFFKNREDVDPDLITSIEQAAWRVAKLAREKVQSKLRPIFSSVQFQSIQTMAYALPRVRPKQKNAVQQLAAHYTPDSVKMELVLSMMRRDSQAEDDRAEPYARKMMYRWLESEFETVEVTSSRLMQKMIPGDGAAPAD